MISYPDEVVVSNLNMQPSNPITDAWYWYPDNDENPKYDTNLIYDSSTQPENREYIERNYVDESCPFPNGRFYKVFRMYPGRGYLVLNRGEDTTLSIPDENSLNKILGGNQITLYKGWNAVSTPKNNESFIIQPTESTDPGTVWHWEQHQQPSINVSLLYGNGETPSFQDITKSNQAGCLYPSGRQYSADKMMTGFGYLIYNSTNNNIPWTVPDVTPSAGNLQIESGTGTDPTTGNPYEHTGNWPPNELTRSLKINNPVDSSNIDIYIKNDDGGFGNSLAESTWSNKQPSSNFANGLPDFNIYLKNATETTAEVWIQSNNPNNNRSPDDDDPLPSYQYFFIFFTVKNNLGHIDKSKITWYNMNAASIAAWQQQKALFEFGFPGVTDPGDLFTYLDTNYATSPYVKSQGQQTVNNPDPLILLTSQVASGNLIKFSNNTPIQLGYIKYTE